MLCIVIKGPTFQEAHEQISKALTYADLVELRLDCFTSLDLDALKILCSHFSIPMIFTLRSQIQGGNFRQSEEKRLTAIRNLIELKPHYLDLETHVPPSFIDEISSQHPEIKLILSYHNFSETPENLEEIYQEMVKVPASFYKMALAARSCIDALRLICWAKKSDNKLIAISIGPLGQISRILSKVRECPITYATLEEEQESALGQLSAKILIEQYHYTALNPHTSVYGLIGDPVDLSISKETHNSLIKACGFNAVYIKMQVTPMELSDFLKYARQLPFHGISVTMPLKEHVLSFLDEIDPQASDIGAVNTLLFEKGKIIGFNTDGKGALNAIESQYPIKNKRIVIIGAGGAAKAIAFEANLRGALVTIVNRDLEKALQLARHLHCIGKGLDYLAASSLAEYDILINCTPTALEDESIHILPGSIVMDINTQPKETEFLKHALKKNCPIIYGYKMFIEQALGQFNIWFKNRFNIQESRKILEKKAEDCVSKDKFYQQKCGEEDSECAQGEKITNQNKNTIVLQQSRS